MLHMITDWEELLLYLTDIEFFCTTTLPEPTVGDIWVLEQSYFLVHKVREARSKQIPVLVIGTNPEIKEQYPEIDFQFMGGDYFDPNDMLNWIKSQTVGRPKFQKRLQGGSSISFAGLLPTGGGVGKDTIIGNTAYLLSKRNKNVVVIDADPYGTLKERYKVESNFTIDLWRDRIMGSPITAEKLYHMIPKTHLGFYLIPASISGRIVEDDVILSLYGVLSQAFDIVIWNMGSGLATKEYVNILKSSNKVFLIGLGDRTRFPKSAEIYSEYQSILNDSPLVILNRFYEQEAVRFFNKEYNVPVFSFALEDRKIFDITEQGKSFVSEYPKHMYTLMIQKIADQIDQNNINNDNIILGEKKIKKDKKRSPFRLF